MIIDFGYGEYVEADHGPRNTELHKRIVRVKPLFGSSTGYQVDLECGHRALAFGALSEARGVVLCRECRDRGTERVR